MSKSYQRRKQDIKFYQQCVKELEELACQLAGQIPNRIRLPLPGGGVAGDDYLTPYNCDDGSFFLRLYEAQAKAQRP